MAKGRLTFHWAVIEIGENEKERIKMKMQRYRLNLTVPIIFFCVMGILLVVSRSLFSHESCLAQEDICIQNIDAFNGSCTVFAIAHENDMLFGNNEDFTNPITYIWATRPYEGSYGGVYFGYQQGKPQGGINDQGLAFDAMALPEASLNPQSELPSKGSSDSQFLGKMMSQSKNVAEVIEFAKEYNWGTSISFQVLLADRTGDAVIISAGRDGELTFTRKSEGDSYLIGTNFNRANPDNRSGAFPCRRYEIVDERLSQIGNGTDLSVDYIKSILDAVHIEGVNENTLYSNIFDLKNGQIYLYYWHQFDEVVTLNVQEQIEKGLTTTRISELFSNETITLAEREHQKHIARDARDDWLYRNGKIIIGGGLFVVLLGFFGVVAFFHRRKK